MNIELLRIKEYLQNNEFFKMIKNLDAFAEKLYDAYHCDTDIIPELKKADFWLISNPTRRKKNYARFLCNWMSRTRSRL
ncbi:MAG: hypothetical protein AB1349_10330 [Elusimicrobiota bacterium]